MTYYIQVGWDDVPHLDEDEKAKLKKSFPLHELDARTKGIPMLGSGAIYPIPRTEIEVKPFQIPAHWKKAYALDVGWNKTAAIWGAKDMTTDTIYLWAEHYRGQAVPAIHASAIKARGEWIRGAIDPAARGRNQTDGQQLIESYRTEGLKLTPANNAVEAGIFEVWQRMETGRLKVFSTLNAFWTEFLTYSRDENGKIIKKNDHLLDACRYLVMTWNEVASYQTAEAVGGGKTRIADQTAGY